MKLKHRNFAVEVKAAEDGTFTGYGSVFGVVDSYNDIVAKGAFVDSLAKTKAAGRSIPVLWQHNMQEPIGVYVDLSEDDYGLKVTGQLAVPDVQRAREAYALMKMGAVHDMSIGYFTDSYSVDNDTGIYTLTKLELVEVSIVTLGANPAAQINSVKSRLERGEKLTEREFEELLREQGFSKGAAAKITERGYKALLAGDRSDGSTGADLLKILNSFGAK